MKLVTYYSQDYAGIIGAGLDRGNCVDVIYLDFQKTFDSVPHECLLCKL